MEDLKSRKTWIFLIVAALIEWVVVHLVDVARFGTVSLWAKILTVVTLGSQKYKDLPYADAAKNPYPVTPLAILMLMFVAGGILVTWKVVGLAIPIFSQFLRRRTPAIILDERRTNRDTLPHQTPSEYLMALITWGMVLGVLEVAVVSSLILANAIEIRSVYEVDRDIIAPYISPDERVAMQSQFAQVTTKAQFQKVMNNMEAVALQHHIKLLQPKT